MELNNIDKLDDHQQLMRLSKKLLIAFDDLDFHLLYEYICLSCFGIVISPMKCKLCNASYCEKCFIQIVDLKIFCFCKERSKESFAGYID